MDTYGVAREQSVEKSQKNFIVPAVLLCALIMVGILLAPVQAFAATTKLDFRGTRDYAMAFQVLNLVNAERAKLSRPAVKMDATLLEAAMLRAAESRLFFSHTRPNGTSFSTVMPVASNRSENIAIGQTTAANVMAAWINSPGHYNNLMNANMTSIGVGCFELGNVRGWVQLFSTNAAANATQPANRVVVENIVVREDWLTIGVAPSTINLAVGATQALTTTVRVTGSGANPDTTWGAALPTESSGLQYTSNNTTVATVNASGTVTGVRGGTASVSIAPKGSTKSTSASVTVTAPVYTVTYNANGGSVSPASNAVNQGNSVTLPTPTRSGYTFNGWFTAATGGTKISSPYAPTASITLFAQWTQTITYNANGGTVTPSSNVVNAGSSVTLPTPTRSGYTFNGWFTAATGGTKISSPYTPTGNVTLFAQWTQNVTTYTVTYNANGGSVSPASSAVNQGSSVTLPTPTRSGWTFNGWFTAATGGTKVSSPYTPTAAITLFAQWTRITYLVTYNANGGVVLPTSNVVNAGSSVTLPTPTRNGYTFNGWFTTAAGGTKVNNPYIPTSAITLFAQWTQNPAGTQMIIFDRNDGSEPTTELILSGEQIGTLLPTGLTRTGYTFKGWFDAKTGGTKITATYVVNDDVTLYAQWSAKKYTIKYYSFDGKKLLKSVSANYDSKLNAGSYAPKRVGKTFVGWFTAKTGGTKVTEVKKNQSVYARYVTATYTVKYFDHKGIALPVKTIKHNASPGAGPKRTGYTFIGWYTAKSGGTKVTKVTKSQSLYARYRVNQYTTKYYNHAGKLIKATKTNYNAKLMTGPKRTGYTFQGWFTAKTGGTKVTHVTKSRTVYARYKINQYTIKYYNHTGATLLETRTRNYNTGLMAGPKRMGYTFIGWYTAKSGGTKVTKVTKNQSLYARYRINQYTTKYYDGSKLIKTTKTNYNTKLMAGPKRTGYVFDGWYTAKTGGTKITNVTANRTVYARYIKYVAVTGFYSFPAHWSSVTIGVGSTETFGVGVAPANATNQRISVKSSNPNIASVTVSYEQGKGSMVNNVRIIGKQAGKATITLTTNDGGFKKTMTVTVVPAIPLQSIEFGFAGPEFSGGRFTIPAGLASYAVVGFTPAQATNKALTVVSSNPAIATAFIEEQGFGLNPILWVQAVSRGNATITVTSVDGGLRLTAPVTVVTGR